jgi:hypothetical protein
MWGSVQFAEKRFWLVLIVAHRGQTLNEGRTFQFRASERAVHGDQDRLTDSLTLSVCTCTVRYRTVPYGTVPHFFIVHKSAAPIPTLITRKFHEMLYTLRIILEAASIGSEIELSLRQTRHPSFCKLVISCPIYFYQHDTVPTLRVMMNLKKLLRYFFLYS